MVIGELELEVPDYVKMQQDLEAKTATLTILDIDQKDQHEMWGTYKQSWSWTVQKKPGPLWEKSTLSISSPLAIIDFSFY